MIKDAIQIELSPKELQYKPGGPPVTFDISVINQTDQFATFQIEIEAPIAAAKHRWYRLYPEISSKQPPGDVTQFRVEIIDNPKPGSVGLMTLKVWVYILELRQKDWQSLPLFLEKGTTLVPLKVELLVQSPQAQPNELVEIPVQIGNPSQLPMEAIVTCAGLDPAWFPDGTEQRKRINPGEEISLRFACQIPAPTQALSQAYPFVMTAQEAEGPVTQAPGTLHITSAGSLDFRCTPLQRKLPQYRWWPNWWTRLATYTVDVANESNVPQVVTIAVKPDEDQPKCQIQVVPEQAELGLGQTSQFAVTIGKRRRWFGWMQKLLFEVKPALSDPRVEVRTETQLLKLILYPVFPIWLQGVSALATLFLLWWFSCLNPASDLCGHRQAVNGVKFNGVGDKLVSASDDQSMINWLVAGFSTPLLQQNLGIVGKTGKSVGVVRFRPLNNDVVAAGLENGEIQFWSTVILDAQPLISFTNLWTTSTLNEQPFMTLTHEPGDRVFDLVFTQDARTLYSGHGSGRVVEWNISPENLAAQIQARQQREQSVGFAINALALVGPAHRYLAIAGRFNQLVLWDLQEPSLQQALSRDKYGSPGSEGQYIFSLASPLQNPYRLASADNQGRIRIWDLHSCLEGTANCQIVDEWQPDRSVKSIAFTADGCYLASASESGQAMVWSLAADGRRSNPEAPGLLARQTNQALNAIDVVRMNETLLVATGGNDHAVEVSRISLPTSDCR